MSRSTAKSRATAAPAPASAAVVIYTSSEARRDWKNVTERALAGERIAILIGKRAVSLRPVELTYVEEEYGVGEAQLHDKAQEVLQRARKARTGKSSRLL